MNLFNNIFDQFAGQAQPQVPFGTPQAPRTNSYVAPNVPYSSFRQPQAQVAQKPVQNEATTILKQKYWYNDNDIEFLQQAKEKGIDSKRAFEFLNKKKEQERQWPDLWFFGGAKELAVGWFRAWEQIPRLAGAGMDYLTQNVTWPLVAGGLDLVWADKMADRYRDATKTSGEAFKRIGNDITMAGMTDGGTNPLTQKQIEMRQLGWELGLTAPIGWQYISGAKWMLWLAWRSWLVSAWFWAVQPIADKWAEATLEDIWYGAGYGGVAGAIGWPVLAKTFKYGKAGYYGWKEWVGKSISRDVNWVVDSVTAIPSQIASIPSKIKSTIIKSPEDRLVSKLWQENTQWVVQGKTVNIPVPKKWIVETVTMGLWREKDTKVLAGRALTPSYAGKTPKQIVNTTADVEKNTKKLYEGVRTGEYQWDISTLDEAANTVVTNLERIGAQIWDDVKWAVWKVKPSTETKSTIRSTLKNKIEQRSWAYYILKNFLTDTWKGLSVQDAMKAKRVYQTEIGKLIRSGDAGTDSYSALVKWVQELSDNIDWVVEKSIGSKEFLKRKAQYSHLKKLVTDIAKSAAVEWRRSPQTFVEQLGMVESMLDAVRNPLSTAGRIFAKEIGELNTRGWAWKELIKIYDTEAIKAVKKPIITPKKKVITPDKPIVKPNTIKNESKVNNTQSGDTIPEGYFKNAFWEIQKNPSNKKWGFIKIPEIGKKVDIETNNFENFTSKFKSFEEFKNAVKVIDSRDISNREWNRITRMVWTKNWEFDSLDSFIENYSSEFPYWRSWFEKNSVNAIKKAMNDEYITVYRALPKWKSIEWWDWIALTKEYAEAHLWNMEKWNWVIISIKVPKKDVFNAYTDPNEWLYAPQNKLNWINSLEDFYKQYSNKPKIIVKPESKSIVKNPLVEEARKYKTFSDFEDALNWSSNSVSSDKYTLWKASRLYMAKADPETHINLKDFQSNYWYEADRVWIKNIWKNWKVTIYRSSTWDIQPWDWIAFDKKYAEWHSRTSKHKIYTKEVPVEDVLWAWTSWEEWFYAPKETLKNIKSEKQIYEQSKKLSK